MLQLPINLKTAREELARRSFQDFVTYTKPEYQVNWHHALLCRYLQDFADGKIKKMMVFMPPQHGKSELTSRRLPAYILGKNQNAKIVGCSYSADLAKSFNRDVQRIIDDPTYNGIYPKTILNGSIFNENNKSKAIRNSDRFDIVDSSGYYKSVGVGGSLTGTAVDIGLIDDPVKDGQEAESPTMRARVWDWYTQVFLTRLHNDSQQLLTMTRWHTDDLAGRILKSQNDWLVLKLPAIKNGQTIEEDIRNEGEALWESRHSKEKLLSTKKLNERSFHALYQQNPKPFKGGLVYSEYSTVDDDFFDKVKQRIYYGLDFGFTAPAACVALKIDEANRNIYVKQIVYQSDLTNPKLARALKDKGLTRGSEVIADSAEPKTIKELNKDFIVRKADKSKGTVIEGIKKINEYNILITRSSYDVLSEIEKYQYKTDTDGKPLEEVLKEHDHAMDALRYALYYAKVTRSKGLKGFG